MFRTKLRRASISDLIKSGGTQDKNPSIYDENAPMDIDLDDIVKPSELNSNKPRTISLNRHYKLFDLIVFTICNVVGSGIYVLAGTAGKNISGPGLLISLIFGLFSAGLSALCYAEFASRAPIIGGDYTYLYISVGESVAFALGGLMGVVNNVCSISITAIAAAGYLRSFIETLSPNLSQQELQDTIWFGKEFISTIDIISINIAAPLIVLIFTILILCDIKISATAMNIATIWNILLLLLFTTAFLLMFNSDYMSNPCIYNDMYTNESCPSDVNNSWLPFGFTGILQASPIAFWAFLGGEGVANMAQESVNPTKDIPRAIYITLALVFILYEFIMFGLFGMVPFFSLDETAPLAEAFGIHDEITLQRICAFGAFSTMSIVLFAVIVAGPRVTYRISLDGLFPKCLSYVHHTTRTPFIAVMFHGILGLIISMFFDLTDVLSFASVSLLMNYTFIAIATLIMRYCPPSLDKILIGNKKGNVDIMSDILLTPYWTDMKIFKFLWSFFFVSLFTAFVAVNYEYFNNNDLSLLWTILVIIFGMIMLVQCGVIIYLDKKLPWKDWIISKETELKDLTFVPLSPYSQCALVMFNCWMAASSGILLFAQWLGFVILGVIAYVLYGYRHSNMNPLRQSLL